MEQMGGIGAQCLASVLESNQVLEHLILNGCDLGDDGLEPVANGQIISSPHYKLTMVCVVKYTSSLHFVCSVMSQ